MDLAKAELATLQVLVAAFHIFRAFFVNGLATHTWALFDRLGLSAIGRRFGATQEEE